MALNGGTLGVAGNKDMKSSAANSMPAARCIVPSIPASLTCGRRSSCLEAEEYLAELRYRRPSQDLSGDSVWNAVILKFMEALPVGSLHSAEKG